VGEIALAKEPLEVAVGGRADVISAQGGMLAVVAECGGAVALGAVGAIELQASRDGVRVGGEGIGAGMIARWDALPAVSRSGGEGESGAEKE